MRRPRRLVRRLAELARGHHALLLVIGGTLTLVGALLLGQSSPESTSEAATFSPSPLPSPLPEASFTYAGSWTLAELVTHLEAGEVLAVTIANESATPNRAGARAFPVAALRDGTRVPIALAVTPGDALDSLRAAGYGRVLTAEALRFASAAPATPTGAPGPIDLLRIVMILGGMLALAIGLSRFFSSAQRIGRGRSYAVAGPAGASGAAASGRSVATRGVRLADVAGADEAKLEVTETIEFLRDPARFARLGAKVPRGLLFYGPPGTGKTMLARAVAAEAEVPFFAASGSEFVEMYVGVGAARIRKLFAEARQAVGDGSGAVIFIDELDALARRRGGANSNDERESTVNELLVAMDGFGTDERVIVIGATNRLDTLDPAVLRPGRFTRKIPIGLPDREGRLAILAVHASDKPLDASIDLGSVARMTVGYSGADLADLLNESAILAAREDAELITIAHLRAAMLKLALGVGRRRSMPPRERSIIAAHEAGHAICGHVAGANVRIDHISLFAHGDALGVTVAPAIEDDLLPSEGRLHALLVRLMGGRAAEELCFRDLTGGAADDLERASELARTMVERWGLGVDPDQDGGGATGRGSLSVLVGDASSETAAARDRAVKGILDRAYAEARSLLLAERERLDRVAAYLFEHERIDGDEFVAIFEGRLAPSSGEVGAWRDASASPRDWGELDDLARTTAPTSAPSPAPVGRAPAEAPRRIPRRGLRAVIMRLYRRRGLA